MVDRVTLDRCRSDGKEGEGREVKGGDIWSMKTDRRGEGGAAGRGGEGGEGGGRYYAFPQH